MASRLADAINEVCVKPEVGKKVEPVIGRILKTYPEKNMAKLQYTNHISGAMIEVDDVHIGTESIGVMGSKMQAGDECIITFFGTGYTLPVITRFIDKKYQVNTRLKSKHSRKGAFLPDTLCQR